MTVQHILIGFGGTGARVVESMAMLCAAGIGPERVSVVLIDSDGAHGNGERTAQLLTRYHHYRRNWAGNGTHHIDYTAPDAPDFGRVVVAPLLDEGRWSWSPPPAVTSLHALAQEGGVPVADGLLESLFQSSGTELYRAVQHGLNGQAHIGAALFGGLFADSGHPVLRALRHRKGEPARVLLVGSGFGGTGTGAMVALIRALLNGKAAMPHLELGAVIVPPYFDFGVEAAELRHRTDMAMRALSELPVQILSFQNNGLTPLSVHGRSGRGQCNPSMAAELTAAARGLSFLEGGAEGPPGAGLSTEISLFPTDMRRLQTMLRMAHFVLYEAQGRLRAKRSLLDKNWALSLSGKFDAATAGEAVNVLTDVSRRILEWAGSIQVCADGNGDSRSSWTETQWRIAPLLRDAMPVTDTPRQPVHMAAALDAKPNVAADAFDAMITGPAAATLPNRAAIIAALRRKPALTDGHRGMGRAIVAAYRAVKGVD